MEEACGIGITVDRDEIKQSIASLIGNHREELVKERYTYPISKLLYSLKEGRMKWADGKVVKEELDYAILALLGEETEEDRLKKVQMKSKAKSRSKAKANSNLNLSNQPTTSIADGFVEAYYVYLFSDDIVAIWRLRKILPN